jgi:dolichol-phosphate mannosyltransferase
MLFSSASTPGPELTVVVPTYNERNNVEHIVASLGQALAGVRWEVVFVDDDSPDGTAERVRELATQDTRVRCLQRVGRRGLSSACVEGVLASAAPFVAVMDADLQHDERLLPRMLAELRAGDLDLVVGSRYMEGGGTSNWPTIRRRISEFATWLGRTVIGTNLSDPMSGFFMLRRELLETHARELSSCGFKILLDLVATARGNVRYAELPYEMRARERGESKLDSLVIWEYLRLLGEKSVGRWLPLAFLGRAALVATGAVFHLAIVAFVLGYSGVSFGAAQAVAAVSTIVVSFLLANQFTSKGRRQKGVILLGSLAAFVAIASVGIVVNTLVATWLFDLSAPWWLAGLLGALLGVAWNRLVNAPVDLCAPKRHALPRSIIVRNPHTRAA